ncbi:hypothetical protein B0H16DRAFT_1478358 [Mycena metata]|uniref:Uncharacterized protein n=1 Tax=Mycena metata TaxID=1033252 RepID=A0AAD7MEI4_9AGAR|nr:hypothetical protein B0H16DRAFT_1478358 [Mycena metata]
MVPYTGGNTPQTQHLREGFLEEHFTQFTPDQIGANLKQNICLKKIKEKLVKSARENFKTVARNRKLRARLVRIPNMYATIGEEEEATQRFRSLQLTKGLSNQIPHAETRQRKILGRYSMARAQTKQRGDQQRARAIDSWPVINIPTRSSISALRRSADQVVRLLSAASAANAYQANNELAYTASSDNCASMKSVLQTGGKTASRASRPQLRQPGANILLLRFRTGPGAPLTRFLPAFENRFRIPRQALFPRLEHSSLPDVPATDLARFVLRHKALGVSALRMLYLTADQEFTAYEPAPLTEMLGMMQMDADEKGWGSGAAEKQKRALFVPTRCCVVLLLAGLGLPWLRHSAFYFFVPLEWPPLLDHLNVCIRQEKRSLPRQYAREETSMGIGADRWSGRQSWLLYQQNSVRWYKGEPERAPTAGCSMNETEARSYKRYQALKYIIKEDIPA